MHVAVVIVGFRNPGDIDACLGSLEASSHRDFEVIICENGGREAHAALETVLRRDRPFPVRLLPSGGNVGFAGGVNLGIRAAPDADAWWILNPDTQPAPTTLQAMVARLQRGDCDGVGGELLLPTGVVQSYGGRWRPWLARAESLGKGRASAAEVDPATVEREQNYLNGASMLVSRRFIAEAGLMREEYFLYCEEVEWCLRAARRGLRIGFAVGAEVLHDQGATTGSGRGLRDQPRLPVYLGERNKMLLTRDLYPARLPVAAVVALGLLILRYGRNRAWRQLGYGLSGWWRGLCNERGAPKSMAPA